MLPWLMGPHPHFPSPHHALAEPDGLLAAGGRLTTEWLIHAYRHGIFPWYSPGDPVLWWSPDPRMVLYPERFKRRRSLVKRISNGGFHLSLDRHFSAVLDACAAPRGKETGTWITREMHKAYCDLHRAGVAHSLEVHRDGHLVGGLYGVAMGAVFFGESMFSHQPDASKVALASLAAAMQQNGGALIDCQMHTPHLESLGAAPLSRHAFLGELDRWLPAATDPQSANRPDAIATPPWLERLADIQDPGLLK